MSVPAGWRQTPIDTTCTAEPDKICAIGSGPEKVRLPPMPARLTTASKDATTISGFAAI